MVSYRNSHSGGRLADGNLTTADLGHVTEEHHQLEEVDCAIAAFVV